MRTTTKQSAVLAAVLAAVAAQASAIEYQAGKTLGVPQIAPIKTGPLVAPSGAALTESLKIETVPGTALEAGIPQAQTPANQDIVPQAQPQNAPSGLSQAEGASASFSDQSNGGPGWSQGAHLYDGGKELSPVDGSGPYYGLSYAESTKIAAATGWARQKSSVFATLNSEFERKGGYYMMSSGLAGGALATSGYDRGNRPVVVLSHDLLNRFNGRDEDEYRGAPWEFIASIISREQVLSSAWYNSIPASAEKLAASFMNMAKVFADLTGGTTRSWATDKDFQQNPGDKNSWVAWGWYEQLVNAARAAVAGVGGSTGHLIDSKFLSWARDWVAPKEARNPSFQYTLWELFDGKYYRPGDAKHGQAIPASAGRIDKATYDRESYKVYGADGKASDKNGQLDRKTIYGWIIDWLKGRSEA